jgi:hypothetical protein
VLLFALLGFDQLEADPVESKQPLSRRKPEKTVPPLRHRHHRYRRFAALDPALVRIVREAAVFLRRRRQRQRHEDGKQEDFE